MRNLFARRPPHRADDDTHRDTAAGCEAPGAGGAIPVHPEAVPGEPDALRWVLPPQTLAVRGAVTHAPGDLGTLLDSGALRSIVADPDGLVLRLGEGRTWREIGPRTRTALMVALADPAGWEAGRRLDGPDSALREAALAAIDGEAGDYVRSHGGHIDLVDARNGCVEVRLTGACGHCPAARTTLAFRVEKAIRAAYPDLTEVRQVS